MTDFEPPAAKRTGKRYVFATYSGYAISNEQPDFQSYVDVQENRTVTYDPQARWREQEAAQ